jgi:DNA-binding transcriptional regulator YhcF (GntR family)
MKTQIIKKTELPPFLPHGWKKEIAKVLNLHPNTVKRALQAGKGLNYDKIVKAATEKFGKPTKIETL